ncbi:hypothetical protein [Streptomyces sp. NPDC001914]|uniref:hypothetical protein n=1 Tax=Streptomyces sp. NPDC001914 TaxID=3364623 RepID=UPI0036B67353
MEGRYHVTLVLDGKPTMHGWWKTKPLAMSQYGGWIGRWGRPGARITVVDADTEDLLAEWPSGD